MKKYTKSIAMWTALLASLPIHGSGDVSNLDKGIEIILENGTDGEKATRKQLSRLLKAYDLTPWTFTRKLVIDEKTRIPHSHPVLTLNTDYPEGDYDLLATFVHEQLHWHLDAHENDLQAAVATFQTYYAKVPVRGGQGARSEFSTYMHLANCWLEYDAMIRLIGKVEADKLISKKTYYTWIYGKVLEETARIAAVVKENGLLVD